MYQLYIANKNYSSWSLRPWVLLKTLSIPFEEKLVAFAPGMAQPAFKAFSPTAKVPCLIDGETTVWDSLAIPSIWLNSIPASGLPMPKPVRGHAALPPKCTLVLPHCVTPAL
ncbi:hypothetical protein Q7O_004206 [Pectobacterium carotovorum subsp. carotovorum PCCS1]|nr:hypothetical protein [Pectobacterium carotovorum subsp. carotovorum PCCS1]